MILCLFPKPDRPTKRNRIKCTPRLKLEQMEFHSNVIFKIVAMSSFDNLSPEESWGWNVIMGGLGSYMAIVQVSISFKLINTSCLN